MNIHKRTESTSEQITALVKCIAAPTILTTSPAIYLKHDTQQILSLQILNWKKYFEINKMTNGS